MSPLRPEDHPILANLRVAALRTDPGAFLTPLAVAQERRPEGWRRQLEEYAAPGYGAILAAWVGPEPVGMAGLRCVGLGPDARGEVWGVFVIPAWRGRGIGTELMRAVEAEARRLGRHRLLLDVVRTNEAAARLYMAAGFRGTGRRVHQRMGDGQTREVVEWGKAL